ncbi:MAG: efflux RND transporter permease subunit [Planctomycetota bacterium]
MRDSRNGAAESARGGGLVAWFAGNHVAANLLMLLLMVGGGVIASSTRVEVFPEIDPRTITVNVPYPGATPVEVEEGICRRVEEAVTGIQGVERIRSESREGVGTVTVELEESADDREVLDDVKSAVESIQAFPPQDAEDVQIADADAVRSVITIALFGSASEKALRELAFDVRDQLTGQPGISIVDVQGVRNYEIAVEVRERDLRKYGLSFAQVARAVTGFSVNLPGGSIRTDAGEVLLRTDARAYDRQQFEQLVVRSAADGTQIRVGDVATVRDEFEDVERSTQFNGQPAAFVSVSRVGDQRALDIEANVKAFVAQLPLPAGVEATIWRNDADALRSRVDLLTRNGLMGVVLVFAVLVLFLDLRLAFWTTMGLPIAFLGSFVGIVLLGGSINMISLFAFIVVLGIVVDDAIVVGESIFAKREAGLPPLRAAIEGVRDVLAPVTAAVLTTVLAFIPLYFTKGIFGDILWVVPVVVVSCLLMSLIEAFLILPAHLSGGGRRQAGALTFIQERLRHVLDCLVQRVYVPALQLALRFRYATMAAGVAVFGVTVGLMAGGHVRSVLFPDIDGDEISVRITMLGGTPASRTREVLEDVLAKAEQVRQEFAKQQPPGSPSLYRNVSATLGSQPFSGGRGPESEPGQSGAETAEVAIELLPGEERTVLARDMTARWRELVGEVPGARQISFTSALLSAGDDISVELAHADVERLTAATDRLATALAGFEGVSEVADSFEQGKRELKVALSNAGLAAGLTLEELARQVRQAFYGAEAQRIQRGRDDIKVMVRYSEAERRQLATIEDMRVRLPAGGEVPFRTVAEVTEGRGFVTIDRTDRRRVVQVTADVDDQVTNATRINQLLNSEVLPAMSRDMPGLSYSFEGAERERDESLESLMEAMLIAVFGIFALLATTLRSYVQPLIIVAVVPFGIVGAVAGHLVLGFEISFFSAFGVVALAGVVVNDALVLIDMFNKLRAEGRPVAEAALAAGSRRFRPILFTTLTTCAGLAPMIFEKSLQAQFLIPMAVSLAGGVAFATVITLFFVPSLLLIQEDLRCVLRRVLAGGAAAPATVAAVAAPRPISQPGGHLRS